MPGARPSPVTLLPTCNIQHKSETPPIQHPEESRRTRVNWQSGYNKRRYVPNPEIIRLTRNGWMPNNDHLPVLLYRKAIQPSGTNPAAASSQFERNGWPPQWRDSIYDSTTTTQPHTKRLASLQGRRRSMLGGESGHRLEVRADDIGVLPAGTGYCKLEAAADFLVVGAYPPVQQ